VLAHKQISLSLFCSCQVSIPATKFPQKESNFISDPSANPRKTCQTFFFGTLFSGTDHFSLTPVKSRKNAAATANAFTVPVM